ncbi:FAD-binding oxidoreductase [Actinokineospora inagensis]|uniref:FAD-binding oxidoreductase n=1 Tax=Actinokineospora inagensis TaxID=103730 RepID=UPI00040C8C59|nr:FAD-binding oxidoreductase [Actinokineospora inagensis]
MTLSRRSLLRASAGAAIATAATAAAGPVWPSAWEQLRRNLQGTLVLPGSADYPQAKQLHFAEFDAVNPSAIAYCASARDVVTSVCFAQDHGIRVTARSGGHSPAGYSLTDGGLVVDLSRLRSVTSGPSSVVIGPGVQQVDALNALWPQGLGIVGGLCPTVGAGGFIQGGGIGMLTRKHGLGCDHLLGADVVLADGRLVHTSAAREPDLFWALRGGGGGNFGIVTAFEVTPVPVNRMINFSTSWAWADAADVIRGWQQWAVDAPLELGSGMVVQLTDAAPGAVPVVLVFGAWSGSPAALETALDDLASRVGHAPTSRTAQDLTYRDAMMQRYNCSERTVDQCHRVGTTPVAQLPRADFTIERSRLFGAAMSTTAVDELLTAFDADRRAGHLRAIHGAGLFGGTANTVAPDATAFVHRDAQFSMAVSTSLAGSAPAAQERSAALAWAATGFGALSRYSTSTYQNFIDPYLDGWQTSYYGANYARLVDVKHQYDPNRFFTFPQAIG